MSEEKRTVVHIDPTEETGRYANAAAITHSRNEFILDFLMLLPGDRRKVVSRLILSPTQTKQLAAVLQENLARYESTHGKISVSPAEPEFTGRVN
ncbi:MAG: DUF3467 domain-containing protein [bacterium]|nr:MAG: DUF3467 domain-containing protein [bacterium]